MTENTCNDKKCPVHADVAVRGRKFNAVVVSNKMKNGVVVEKPYVKKIQKYERFEKRKTRISAHKPACMPVKTGDTVTVQECRPLSKTISFVVIGTGVKTE